MTTLLWVRKEMEIGESKLHSCGYLGLLDASSLLLNIALDLGLEKLYIGGIVERDEENNFNPNFLPDKTFNMALH